MTSGQQKSGVVRAATAACCAVVFALAGIYCAGHIPGLTRALEDALVRAHGSIAPPDDIAVVAIDERSIQALGRFPWPRQVLAKVIDEVARQQPKVIALDVLITDPGNLEDDRALTEAVARAGNVVTAAELASDAPNGRNVWLKPLPALEKAAAGVGHIQVAAESDGAARAMLAEASDDVGTGYFGMAIEAVRVAQRLPLADINLSDSMLYAGAFRIPLERSVQGTAWKAERGTASVRRPAMIPIHYIGPAGAFGPRTFSAADVLQGKVPGGAMRGAYVLIGATAASLGGKFSAPFLHEEDGQGRESGALLSGVEVLANTLDTILHSRFYSAPGWAVTFFTAFLSALLMLWVAGRLDGFWVAGTLVGCFAVFCCSAYAGYSVFQVYLPVLQTGFSVLIAAAAGILWRAYEASTTLDRGILALGAVQPLTIPAPGIDEALRAVVALTGVAGTKLLRGGKVIASFGWNDAAEVADALSLPGGYSLVLSGRNLEPGQRKLAEMILGAALKPQVTQSSTPFPQGLEAKAQAIARIHQNLASQTAFLGSALASVEDGILTVSPDGVIRYANPKACHLLSTTLLTGRDFAPVLFGSDSEALLLRLMADRATEEREIHMRGKTLTVRLAPIALSPAESPLGIVISISDVTKQHALAQTKNDVINLVSHEMRTPLTAIQGMTELLAQYEIEPVRRKELHLAMHDEVKRLGRMIGEYLDITRLEAGATPVRMEPLRIETVIERAVLMFEAAAMQKNIRLQSVSGVVPPLLGDADLLMRALQNLISNAIKYSPSDTVVGVQASALDGRMRIAVSDQGPGIPEGDRERIFEKFYRVPRLADAGVPGTGLGLTLVREIAALHGGTISVAENPGGGSRFQLEIPLTPLEQGGGSGAAI